MTASPSAGPVGILLSHGQSAEPLQLLRRAGVPATRLDQRCGVPWNPFTPGRVSRIRAVQPPVPAPDP